MSTKNTDEQADNPEQAGDESPKAKSSSARRREKRKAHADREQETAGKPVADTSEAGVAPPARGQGAAGFTAVLALLVALAAAAYAGWQGYQLQLQSQQLDTEVASKLSEIETIGSNSRKLSNDAKNVASDVEARIGQLDARLVGLENQRLAMESLYNDLSRSRDEWTLTQVEQILLVASQQLQLADNVKAALVALQAADARLAKSERPQFTQLRRVIEADIERLKSSPFVDVTGIGLKLERTIDEADKLPMAMQTRPAAEGGERAESQATGWRALAAQMWADVLSLVRIERIDASEPPLLAPDQAFFLRENLKLRLLSARLALLARDQEAYKADLQAAIAMLNRYFDTDAMKVSSSIDLLNGLAESNIIIELPDVSASLEAVRKYRLLNGAAAQ